MSAKNQEWGSRIGLILAMAGNAVGLGNFLRFPIQAVQNGGGTFIIPYLVSFVFLGLPLLLIEWSTGKFGGINGHHSPPMIMQQMDKRPYWKYIGSLGTFCSIIICTYYTYMESWTLSYAFHSLFGTFNGMTENEVAHFFSRYLDLNDSTSGIPYDTFLCFIFCLSLNIWILSKGIKNGIEKVAKIAMPALLLFGVFLVIRSFTITAGVDGAKYDGTVGMEFLWTPDFNSLTNPKVWLAAGGQVFFTMSLGMGCIQSYSSYIRKHDDIVLNSMAAGFTNEFTEIIIGSAIIIPISVGYFGIDRVLEMTQSGGFGIGFCSLPYLFSQWGPVLSALAGTAFFGLLFFSAVTSSIAISVPMVAFFTDNYDWSQKKASYIYGILLFFLALPPILFFQEGVLDEYDFWSGTFVLFFFGMIETVVFSWVMGVNRGWRLIHYGAEFRLPVFFKYILKYVTPVMLITIFVTSIIKPKNDDWSSLSLSGWEVDNSSLIGVVTHKGIGPNCDWISDHYYSDYDGTVSEVSAGKVVIDTPDKQVCISLPSKTVAVVNIGDKVSVGDVLSDGRVYNNVFFVDIARIILLLTLLVLLVMIYFAYERKKPINKQA